METVRRGRTPVTAGLDQGSRTGSQVGYRNRWVQGMVLTALVLRNLNVTVRCGDRPVP